MTHADFLIHQATRYWNRGEHLPIDLFAQLIAAGLDVDALERTHMKEPA